MSSQCDYLYSCTTEITRRLMGSSLLIWFITLLLPQFSPLSRIGRALNKVGCVQQSDLFPSASPWVLAIGGTMWPDGDPSKGELIGYI